MEPFNSQDEPTKPSPEEALRRFSYAEEFGQRQRRSPWVYAFAIGVFALTITSTILALTGHGLMRNAWLLPAVIGFTVLLGFAGWVKGSPVCPACQQDITICTAVYCHVCGERLKERQCERCHVDESWTAGFRSAGDIVGNKATISYCPGCSVWLSSDFYRGRDH